MLDDSGCEGSGLVLEHRWVSSFDRAAALRPYPVLEFPGGWPPRVPAGSPQQRQVAAGSCVGRGDIMEGPG